MKNDPALPSLPKRLWSRRWVRRLTYMLACGAALAGAGVWALRQPYVDRLLVAKLDEIIRQETGLAFQAESLEVHPFQGRVVLHRVTLGGDLFQALRVELEVDLPTILRMVHVRRFLLESPRLNLDAQRLATLHLRDHPSKAKASWRVDRVEITDGLARVDEPAWGLPEGEFTFRVDGRGRLPNQLWLDVKVPRMSVGKGPDRTQGDMSLKFRYTDKGVDSANIKARLGDSALSVLGACEFTTRVLQAEVSGALDLNEVLRLVPRKPGTPRPASPLAKGFVDFKGKVQGPFAAPAWNLALDGRQIQVEGAPFHPGTLHAGAFGGPGRIHLDTFSWVSSDGKVQGEGGWTRATGTSIHVAAEGITFVPATIPAHLGFLQGLTGRFTVTGSMPSAPWDALDLQKLAVTGTGQFLKGGQNVGGAEFTVAERHVRATALDLQLPEARFSGSASATLLRKGLGDIQAEGDLSTDAAVVADALHAWNIPHDRLDMEGLAQTHAAFQWNARDGIHLDGTLEVTAPRWHGAHADRLAGGVTIRKDVLRVSDIVLEKGEGRAWGDFWITWAPGPREGDGIDMCFRAFRLPIEEGLKAGDQGDLKITGIASGWARLHGPLNDIALEGQAVTEGAQVYGIQIPAASSSFALGINSLRLRATDVRVADSLDHLEGSPGPLDLRGSMDMDTRGKRWTAELKGDVDSGLLGLPGPTLQGRVEGRLEGPLAAPLGPSQAPEGVFTLSQGRLSMEDESIDGIEARLAFRDGQLQAQAGLPGKATPVLDLQGIQTGSRLSCDLRLRLGPDSADTAGVSARLSEGFLKDLNVDYAGHGEWSPHGLVWTGRLGEFTGTFDGFRLVQASPSTFRGDTSGMELAMNLEGQTLDPKGQPSAQSTTMSLGGWIPFDQDGILELKLEGSAELANLKAILDHLSDPGQYSLMADMKPAGTATFNLFLGGRPVEPSLDGRLELRGGRLSERTYPQSIENVDFTALFHGRDMTILQDSPLHGTLAQGALTAWGHATWGPRGLTDYDFTANLDSFQFRDLPEGLELQGDFNGNLRGNDQDGGLLKGTLTAKSLLYQADINLTDVIMAGSMGGASLTSLDPSDPMARIELDLDLRMTRPWECDTNLFKLQGRPTGAFKIRGNLAHPGLKGRMEFLPGGRLTNLLPAGDLVLERGSVDFTDPAMFNPIVDFHGRVDVDPYLVTLDVTGTLDAISAHPSSTPALRPDQIFTILVDPSAASRMDTTQGASNQPAVSTGVFNQGAGLVSSLFLANGLERLRKTLTLDRVNFSILGGPNLSLTLEKSFDVLGHRMPWIYNYKQEGTQTTISGNVEWRFGNLVLQLGARQITGSAQTTGDTTVQGVTPSGEIRYTWSPK